MDSLSRSHVISALCPKFKKISHCKKNERRKLADGILNGLRRKGYRLFFWVIKYKWDNPDEFISPKEISELRKHAKRTHGRLKVFARVGVTGQERARQFRRFVSTNS
jgi:hypothetical protein